MVIDNIINNTRHYYANILKQSSRIETLLKKQWEQAVASGQDAKIENDYDRKLKTSYRIYNSAFAGLMWEGITCHITKSMDFSNKEDRDVIVMFLDGERYDCKATLIKRILRDDYEDIISRCTEINNTETPRDTIITDNINTNTDQPKTVKTKASKTSIKKEPEKSLKIVYKMPNEPEKVKDKEHLVMDFIELQLKGEHSVEFANITVAPIAIPETGNETVTDIIVAVETTKGKNVYISEKDGRKSIECEIGEYEIIINGEWKNGEFESQVIPSGRLEFKLEKEQLSFKPKDLSKVGFGHAVDFIETDQGKTKLHAFPLDITNNEVGAVNTMICIEPSKGCRKVIASNDNIPVYETDKYKVQMFGYWKDDNKFCFNVSAPEEKITAKSKSTTKEVEIKNPLKSRIKK